MTVRIFRSIMLAAGAVLLASILIIMGSLYEYFGGLMEQQLREELALAAAGVDAAGEDYFQALSLGDYRLTWIAQDGSVLLDTQADESGMDNHGHREEVQEALTYGVGQGSRYSGTLMEKTVYYARRLEDGTVLRISTSRATMVLLAMGMLQPILLMVIVALTLAFFLAKRVSARIMEPLNSLDLDHPPADQVYDELIPLLNRISQQRRQIDAQLRGLQHKKDEFEQITASMKEGLVLLDSSGSIISVNPAASRLFGDAGHSISEHPELSSSMTKALNSGHSELSMNREGREYQIDISRIDSQGSVMGLVLLTFDITEKSEAERSRREFTANVSHELKTPLTAILGSAEMIEANMISPQDLPRFVGHIHSEAARLLNLIEDIIRLSRLDEGDELPWESLDLALAAKETAQQLQTKAAQRHITINVTSESCRIFGVPRLIQEIIYNLTDNAVKYNIEGGTVTVSVAATADTGVLTVSDTGIGIPPEHQQRVFERFYRVDKSHSRQIGGTGLGLSIVKHACAYLGAAIDLQSEVGKGTTIRITFPHKNKED